MSYLLDFQHALVSVVTTDGRLFVGRLEGYDLATNLLLAHTHEMVVSPDGTEVLPLGLFMLRGSTVVCCGLLDEDLYAKIDWATVKGQPLKSTKNSY
ncbi:U6 snRNA-associated Sm-like protein LSm8 [Ascoidea rubescens DSM 1968]|uniref:LSM2-LSM8 complex subunit LSM8 n=1 Tax=Ascoidea rubescens DSM 1968 TaxID=1344418 RepID=A0A1D2VP02_9ASCO|nr:Sm-like ribonucleo protein [Ascoidea rubescens DSM 1968]ODV63352.1 Sm-like ribonucleo protein [Ascoidea rubescens DSM 1968]